MLQSEWGCCHLLSTRPLLVTSQNFIVLTLWVNWFLGLTLWVNEFQISLDVTKHCRHLPSCCYINAFITGCYADNNIPNWSPSKYCKCQMEKCNDDPFHCPPTLVSALLLLESESELFILVSSLCKDDQTDRVFLFAHNHFYGQIFLQKIDRFW